MRCDHVRDGVQCLRWDRHLLHTYKRPNPRGRKARREESALARFRLIVSTRSWGVCDATGLIGPGGFVCSDKPHKGEHCHHVEPNDRDAGRHDPDRGLYLCAKSHAFAHSNPAAASVLGLLRPEGMTA